ncbi:MAG: family 14 glycosylhydrolase [Candidatus Hydrogenedentes bacterium]|nr:family 14 glycosylhydrolase [Candidatus Hydrogenedentota bacterium]
MHEATWRMLSVWGLAVLAGFHPVAVGAADALPSFAAGGEGGGITLVNAAAAYDASTNGQQCLCIREDGNPYEKTSWVFDVPAAALAPQTPYVLEIVFFDKGAGVIEAQMSRGGVALGISRSESYTRLNTLRERTACYQFDTGVSQGNTLRLSLTGLQYLKALRVVPAYSEEQWAAAHEAVPRDVRPMTVLKRPMDLVTTAGISSHAYEPDVEAELQALHNLAPLAKVLGFNGIEMYVRWRLIEPDKEGAFDFAYYDTLVAKLAEYGLKWFPLLIVGSAYALPDWFAESPENVGFVCLEHGVSNPIQSIWSPFHKRHVERVLQAFGAHYEPGNTLLGVRLGPSGNYGESQYPAGGNWPLKGRDMHIHIGLWCADAYGRADFRDTLRAQYGVIEQLNTAWGQQFASFDAVGMMLPVQMVSKRQRADFLSWYTREMTEWCEYWALEARKAMPNTPLYQSSGGWGFVEAGTSYSGQAKSMQLAGGGIRLTNETDSYEQNVNATRLAATAARLYGIELGYEPASSHTARGVAGRLFNTATTNGDHLFTYHPNVMHNLMAIDQWLRYLPVLDERADPVIDVAVYYPETMNQLDDGAFRHLYAWGFNPRAAAVRRAVDVDYLDDLLIRDGFLDRYKVLVFCWGEFIETDVLARVDAWVRGGGVVLYPSFPRGNLQTVEGDGAVFAKWSGGDTGQGRFLRFKGDMEPLEDYETFIRTSLRGIDTLSPETRAVLRIEHPEQVFFSVQAGGQTLALNYNPDPVVLALPDGARIEVPGYGIARFAVK